MDTKDWIPFWDIRTHQIDDRDYIFTQPYFFCDMVETLNMLHHGKQFNWDFETENGGQYTLSDLRKIIFN